MKASAKKFVLFLSDSIQDFPKSYLVNVEGVEHFIPKSVCYLDGNNKIFVQEWFVKKMTDKQAVFSEDNTRRLVLTRLWKKSRKVALCVGLNPSTANGSTDDPTIDLLTRTLSALGFGGLIMVNLFTHISSKPEDLLKPGVMENEEADLGIIFGYALACQEIIFCWGKFEQAKGRAKKVIDFFTDAKCFGVNKDGSPWHPLYCFYAGLVAANTVLFKFKDHKYEDNKRDAKPRKKKTKVGSRASGKFVDILQFEMLETRTIKP